jgi:DNA-binding MurR/RpiR family transcriptional regulator
MKAPSPAKRPQKDALGYTMPRSYEELRAVLSSGSIHLPKRLQQIAVYFWQHPGEVALGTITSIAENAGVQPSALVRFAQAFGYSGFSDFQVLFKAHLKSGWAEEAAETGPGEDQPGIDRDDNHRVLKGLIDAARHSLARLDLTFQQDVFKHIVDVLVAADLIYLVGSKRAFPVTTYMSLALTQQGIRTALIDNIGSLGFDQIGCATARDAVLAINFSPYNSITPDLVRTAKQRGAMILGITDSAFSPLVALSDHCLEVVESEHAGFRSLSATFAMAMALVLAVVTRREAI